MRDGRAADRRHAVHKGLAVLGDGPHGFAGRHDVLGFVGGAGRGYISQQETHGVHDRFGLRRVLGIRVRAVTSAASALTDCGAAAVILGATLPPTPCPALWRDRRQCSRQHHGFAELIFLSVFEGAYNMLSASGTTMALAYWSSAWATASSQPSATWMKSGESAKQATSVSRSNGPEALRLPSVSASASALALSDDLGLYLALLIGAFIQSFAAFGERRTCGVQCGTVIVGNAVRFAAQCVQLLPGIVALGSQRVALGGVILWRGWSPVAGGFLAGDEFTQSSDLCIAPVRFCAVPSRSDGPKQASSRRRRVPRWPCQCDARIGHGLGLFPRPEIPVPRLV